MEPRRLNDADLTWMLSSLEENELPETAKKLRAHLAAMESEHRALVADNAALLSMVLSAIYGKGDGSCTECGRKNGCTEDCAMSLAAAQHRPGTAFLSEMEALRERVSDSDDNCDGSQRGGELCGRCAGCVDLMRKRVAELECTLATEEAERIRCRDGWAKCDRERDEARAQVSTARAAALDEAARAIECGCDLEECKQNAGTQRIRTLATTPLPPVVPVAKVREVFDIIAPHIGPDILDAASKRIGLSRDGEL